MKSFLTLLLLLAFTGGYTQHRFNFGIEGQTSYFNDFENRSLLTGLSLVMKFEKVEVEVGYNRTIFNGINFSNYGYTVIGPNFNVLYHFSNLAKKKSHYFLSSNFQWRKYYLDLGTPPVGGNTPIEEVTDAKVIKLTSTNFHVGCGYEIFFSNRISMPISVSAGMVKHKGTATPFGLSHGY